MTTLDRAFRGSMRRYIAPSSARGGRTLKRYRQDGTSYTKPTLAKRRRRRK